MPKKTKYDLAAEKVLDNWPGTPEELGADLVEATMRIDPPFWSEESRQTHKDDLERKSSARKRILGVEGGKELLELELAFLKRKGLR